MNPLAIVRTSLVIGAAVISPSIVAAQEMVCPGGDVIVRGAGQPAESICEAAAEANRQLASCNLVVESPITIEITHAVPGDCYGLYHCDDDLIQLLPVEAYATYLSGAPDSPFGHLEPEAFFNSVLRHELAHSALDAMPCPYEGCPATQEFVAYTMQIWFLSEADRAPFDERVANANRPMTRDGVNAVILMMSPETFIYNAYAYLSLQDDPCALIGAIAEGSFLFDLPFR